MAGGGLKRTDRSSRSLVRERLLQIPGGVDEILHLVTAPAADQFVAFQSREHVCVAEGSLDVRGRFIEDSRVSER